MMMLFNRKPSGASPSSSPVMASFSALFQPQLHPFPNPNTNLIHRYTIPLRTQTLTTSSVPHSTPNSETNQTSSPSSAPPPQSPEPPSPKKSFAVATGELFLGLASRIIKRPNGGPDGKAASSVAMFESSGKNYLDERIGKVMEDEIEPDVVWEQRVKDVEAEKERRVVTSPGFSFSAAGLLFPYHLGAAQFLIQNGYIKVSCF